MQKEIEMGKYSLKSGGGSGSGRGTIVSRSSSQSPSSAGGNSRTAPRNLASDGKGAGGGTLNSRSVTVKPSSSSGNIGASTALKGKAAAVKNEPATRGSSTHRVTKPRG